MIVYRLETVCGRGVFTPGHAYSVSAPAPSRHPSPQQEKLPIQGLNCGFKSLRQLRLWFNKKQRKELAKSGRISKILLSTYDVPDEFVHIGKFQVTFDKRKAVLVSQQAPDTV